MVLDDEMFVLRRVNREVQPQEKRTVARGRLAKEVLFKTAGGEVVAR